MKIISSTQMMTRTLTIAALLALLLAFPVEAQAPDNYTLEWWTVDDGGAVGQDTTSSYILGGTIGQPDAGVLGDGEYTLVGGFWGSGTAGHRIYLPLVLRNH